MTDGSDPSEPHPPEILLVEDQPVNRVLARGLIEQLGYRVREAENGYAALDSVARRAPDLILMDLQMPGLDGLEATRRLRRSPEGQYIPIIAMTAHALEADRDQCLGAGMDDYLSKPIDRDHLGDLLARHLSGGGLRTAVSANSQDAGPASPPGLNLARLREVTGNDTRTMAELLRMFRDDAPARARRIQAAADAGDHDRLAREAHALKGVLLGLGAVEAEIAARSLEESARACTADEALRAVAELQGVLAKLDQQIETILAGLERGAT